MLLLARVGAGAEEFAGEALVAGDRGLLHLVEDAAVAVLRRDRELTAGVMARELADELG